MGIGGGLDDSRDMLRRGVAIISLQGRLAVQNLRDLCRLKRYRFPMLKDRAWTSFGGREGDG